ncbi:MAG: SLC13 family permease [Stellaceae bacterium]
MSRDQIFTLIILGCLVVLFLWDRLRYDVVALLALLGAVAAGIVPTDKAFNGFANPVLPLIGAALIVSVAIGQSGAVEVLLRRLGPTMRTRDSQVGVLVACVAVLSAFVKNVGALAIFVSAAIQVARRNKRSPSEFLMPLSFASLLGGSMTLIGTSPNLLASAVRQQISGKPFQMFDFTPIGAGLAIVGVLFLAFGWRLLPHRRGAASGMNFTIEDYTGELRITAKSPFIGRTVGDVEKLNGGALGVVGLIRAHGRRQIPTRRWKLYEDDVLVVEADPQTLEQFARDGNLELVGTEEPPEQASEKVLAVAARNPQVHEGKRKLSAQQPPERPPPDDRPLSTIEAVIAPGSDLIGRSAASLHLRERYGVNVLAIGRRGTLRRTRLRNARFKAGDTIVLQGHTGQLPDILTALGCLPLAERTLNLGRKRRIVVPLAILAVTVIVTGFEWVPAQIAFVGAALALVLLGFVTLKEAYTAAEWPILVLIGALIPIGEAVQQNGTAKLIATALATHVAHLPSFAVLAALMAATMLVTPILHHAAAVLVMGPIAASLAQQIGCQIDPFLMAVAFGAGSDFLSPIGHQSNTLVMGLGGYRFGDYWKLGLPLSVMVVALGVPLIMLFWPLH